MRWWESNGKISSNIDVCLHQNWTEICNSKANDKWIFAAASSRYDITHKWFSFKYVWTVIIHFTKPYKS